MTNLSIKFCCVATQIITENGGHCFLFLKDIETLDKTGF